MAKKANTGVLNPSTIEKINALKTHQSIEFPDVNTTQGKGNIYYTVTHHKNTHLPNELEGSHLIDSPKYSKMLPTHPEGKTGTLSNSGLFIPEKNLKTNVPEEKIEFADKSSLLKRIDKENFLEHIKHHKKVVSKELTNMTDGSSAYVTDDEFYETPVDAVIEDKSINLLTNNSFD